MTATLRCATVLAALALIATTTSCTRSVAGDGHYADAKTATETSSESAQPQRLIKLEELPNLMLPAADIASIIGVPGLQMLLPYQTLEQTPEDVISDPACMGAVLGAVEPVYRGSGYQGVFGQRLADPNDMLAGRLDQAIVAFGDGADAKAYVAKQVDSWKGCGGKPLALTVAGMQVNWTVDIPRYVNGVDVLTRIQEGGDGFGCGRGILAADNTVIDVAVCGPDPVKAGDYAAQIADAMQAKYPT